MLSQAAYIHQAVQCASPCTQYTSSLNSFHLTPVLGTDFMRTLHKVDDSDPCKQLENRARDTLQGIKAFALCTADCTWAP